MLISHTQDICLLLKKTPTVFFPKQKFQYLKPNWYTVLIYNYLAIALLFQSRTRIKSYLGKKHSVCLHAQSQSHVWLFAATWTVAHQAALSMGFSRQEYWSQLSFPPPEDLPDPGIEPMSPVLAGRFFTAEPPKEALEDSVILLSYPHPFFIFPFISVVFHKRCYVP